MKKNEQECRKKEKEDEGKRKKDEDIQIEGMKERK